MFFKMFFKENFTSPSFILNNGLDGVLEVPLTVKDADTELPEDILELITEILKNTHKGQTPLFNTQVEEFMALAKKLENKILDNFSNFDISEQELSVLDRKFSPIF